jgi:hypothetical protein
MFSVEGFEFLQAMRSRITYAGQSAFRELQGIGIDVIGFHEPTRLLGASTWVGSIYQPALVIHELVKIASRSREELSKIIW